MSDSNQVRTFNDQVNATFNTMISGLEARGFLENLQAFGQKVPSSGALGAIDEHGMRLSISRLQLAVSMETSRQQLMASSRIQDVLDGMDDIARRLRTTTLRLAEES